MTIALSVAALAGTAVAQSRGVELLERARSALSRLEYAAAVELYQQAEATGQHPREHMIEIYRSIAESHAATGRPDAAETAFRRLLALDGEQELPEGSSPKLTGPFIAAREFMDGRSIAITCRRSDRGGAVLIVSSDPVDLVSGGRLVLRDGGRVPGSSHATGRNRLTLSVPPGVDSAASELACAALDQHGNELLRAPLGDAVAGGAEEDGSSGIGTGGAADLTDTASSRPIYVRWWLWGAAAGLSAGAAIYFGLKMRDAEGELAALNRETQQNEDHEIYYQDALDLAERGKEHARNTNILLGVTAGFSVVSIGLLVHQLVTDRPSEAASGSARQARLNAVPFPGGGAVNLTFGF
jgi:tetratricopeptide (TPR) repeat protein